LSKNNFGSSRKSELQGISFTILAAVILIACSGVPAYALEPIRGRVLDGDGAPIAEARIGLWFKRVLIAENMTEGGGYFEVWAEVEPDYRLLISADHLDTPGIDFLPSWVHSSNLSSNVKSYYLRPAASLILEGDIQFVEFGNLPEYVLYEVSDPSTGEVLTENGFPVVYGSGEESQSFQLGLEPGHLVLPLDVPFKVAVETSTVSVTGRTQRSFEVGGLGQMSLSQGSESVMDVRDSSIRFNIEQAYTILDEVMEIIERMEGYGFYVVRERGTISSVEEWLSDSSTLLGEGRYVESFGSVKEGYIKIVDTYDRIQYMISDAAASVFVIIAYLALTSTTMAFLLSDKIFAKVFGSITIYAVFLIIFYNVYPGSMLVPPIRYVWTGSLSIIISIFVAVVMPHFLRGKGRRGHVPLRNIIVPLFSMAKRTVGRKRQRFLLTLISITMLVMGFVSLTSFVEVQGLITSTGSRAGSPVNAVLLRAPGFTIIDPTFLSENQLNTEWLGRQPEAGVISVKLENLPFVEPVARLGSRRIHGVVGIDPVVETQILDLERLLVDGWLPSENGIVISEALRLALDVEIGDTLQFSGRQVRVDGTFDDNVLRTYLDLDGTYYLPNRLVDATPNEEQPTYEVSTCDTQEVVFCHRSLALEMPFIRHSRISIKVKEGVDVNDFGARMALERNYWTWSVSEEGVQISQVGSYLESKGIPLLVPWLIVVLNVVVTMLNSMYERRKEISILSSVGVNPSQITVIFVAEAMIIGFTAGGLGYLGGLLLYKGMAFFDLQLEVAQKVSAFWSLFSLMIALTAVIVGALAAIRYSTVITPSYKRRWNIEVDKVGVYAPWEISIPVKLMRGEMQAYSNYMLKELTALEGHPVKQTSSIKVRRAEEGSDVIIEFVYKATKITVAELYTRNQLIIESQSGNGLGSVKLKSWGARHWSHEAGTLMRLITMRWSTTRRTLA